MLTGVCSSRFVVLLCIVVLGCRYTVKLLYHVVGGACFLHMGGFECNIVHHRSVAELCMLYIIRCNPMHSLHGALPCAVLYMSQRVHVVLWSHIGILMLLVAAETCSTTRLYLLFSISVERSCRLCIRGCGTGRY